MFAPLSLAAFALTLTTFPAPPLGEEQFGNDPVRANEEWAGGVVAVANDRHRVYRRWVNDNEEFCFQGDADAVNAALAAFAQIDADVAEVVLMPDAGRTRSFDKTEVLYDWRLYAPSGLVLGMARREGEGSLYGAHATLTVHVTGKAFKAGDLELPASVKLLGPHDLLQRYVAGLEHEEEYPRASAVGLLGELSFLPEAIEAIRGALRDDSAMVRRTAARVLTDAGPRGRGAIPRLRELLDETTVPEERTEYKRAIKALAAAPEHQKDAKLRRRVHKLRKLLDGRQVELELERGDDESGRPRFVASLVNRGTLPVLIVQPGDGSRVGWRTPHVRWEVRNVATNELVRVPGSGRCGNMNTISLEEMVTLAPGKRCELLDWFGPPYLPAGGTYRVALRYDNDPAAELRGLSGPHPPDALRLLRRSTPISVVSTPVKVTVD